MLAYPMIERIRQRFPNASIDFLVFAKNADILRIMGIVSEEHINTIDGDSLPGMLTGLLRFYLKMRQTRFHAVIDCELFARISSIISFFSGAPIKVGFHPHTQEGLYRGNFISHPVLYNPYLHISRQFVNLVDAIGSNTYPKTKTNTHDLPYSLPRLTFSAEETSLMLDRFYSDFAHIKEKKLVLINPSGGALPIRAWPLENYISLARTFIEKGYAVGIIGLKGDKPAAEEILANCGDKNCIDLTGYTRSLRELLILFGNAVLLITNDGGPGHFAGLTSLPSLIFFGPETPCLYGPLGCGATVLYSQTACSPCLTAYNHRNSPCDGDNQCLKRIKPEVVIERALEILNRQEDQPVNALGGFNDLEN